VAAIAAMFIIPIPWVYRWLWQWLASQTVLAERGTQVNGSSLPALAETFLKIGF